MNTKYSTAAIYHASSVAFIDTILYGMIRGQDAVMGHWIEGNYDRVGLVQVDWPEGDPNWEMHAVSRAWVMSQNDVFPDTGWGDGDQRSSAVGDIIQLGERFWVTAPQGFDPLDVEVMKTDRQWYDEYLRKVREELA